MLKDSDEAKGLSEELDGGVSESGRILSALIEKLEGMTFRCYCDSHWTMSFVSSGSTELTGYSPQELLENRGISYAQLIHPTDRPMVRREVEEAHAEGAPYDVIYRLLTPRGEKWVWEKGRKVGIQDEGGERKVVEGFVTNITERIQDGAELDPRTSKSPELLALMDIAQDVASTLELENLLGKILGKLKTVLDYDAASIMKLEGKDLEVMAYRGPIEHEKAMEISFSLEEAEANREVIDRKEPVLIDDIMGDDPLARGIRETAGDELENTYDYLRCWMGVPLIVKDDVIGMLTLDHKEKCYYSFQDKEVALAFANQVGVAIENAQLYQAEKERLASSERRRQVAEGLRETMSVVNSSQSLDMVLDTTLDQIYRLLDADSAVIFRLEEKLVEEEAIVARLTTKNPPDGFREVDEVSLSFSDLNQKILDRKPLVLDDISAENVENHYSSSSMRRLGRVVQENFGSSISVPLIVGSELYGVIILYYERRRKFPEEDLSLATTFADQASLAIENARLNKKVEEAAIAEERNRMARELHDSVTQSLYSVTLFAEAAKRLADQGDLGQVSSHLENVERTSQQALKEMRLLIYQMRGAKKRNCCFEDRIKGRLETVERRSGVESSIEVKGNPELTEGEVEQLYLITQEALNNAQKHAQATRVKVSLDALKNGIGLKVEDNGHGFDPEEARKSGGMGLENMRERAEKIGATLSVESELGKGTAVSLELSKKQTNE